MGPHKELDLLISSMRFTCVGECSCFDGEAPFFNRMLTFGMYDQWKNVLKARKAQLMEIGKWMLCSLFSCAILPIYRYIWVENIKDRSTSTRMVA